MIPTGEPITTLVATKVAEGLSEGSKGLISRLLGPAADEIGIVLAGKVRSYFAQNQAAALDGAVRQLAAIGAEPQTVPLRTLLPLMEGAAREDNADMQQHWSALLANASLEADAVPPVFATILSGLDPGSARLLSLLRGLTLPRDEPSASTADAGGIRFMDIMAELKGAGGKSARINTGEISASISLLEREGLVQQTFAPDERWGTTASVAVRGRPGHTKLVATGNHVIRITYLGVLFLKAVSPPIGNGATPK